MRKSPQTFVCGLLCSVAPRPGLEPGTCGLTGHLARSVAFRRYWECSGVGLLCLAGIVWSLVELLFSEA